MLIRHRFFTILFIILVSGNSLWGKSEIKREVDNIKSFSDIYGISRWFVPAVDNIELDWNRIATEGIASVRDCRTEKELKDSLYSFFSVLIPDLKIDKKANSSSELQSMTNTDSTIFWQHLGGELSPLSSLYHSKITGIPSRNLNVGRIALNYYFSPYWLKTNSVQLVIKAHKKDAAPDFSAYALLDYDDASSENSYLNLLRRSRQIRLDLKDRDSTFIIPFTFDKDNSSLNLDWCLYPEGAGTLVVSDIRLEYPDGELVYKIDINGGAGYWINRELYNYQYTGDYLYIREKDYLWDEDITTKKRYIDLPISGTRYYVHIPLLLPKSKFFGTERYNYRSLSIDDTDIRIADYIVAYNALYYFSPLFGEHGDLMEHAFSNEVEMLLKGDSTDYVLRELLGHLKDGHVTLSVSDSRAYQYEKYYENFFPAVVTSFDGRMIVIDPLYSGLEPGDEIVQLDGKNPFETFKPGCISGSPQLRNAYLEMFSFPVMEKFSLSVIRKGILTHIDEKGISFADYYNGLHHSYNMMKIGPINDKTIYVNLADIDSEELDSILRDRQPKQTVIYDARHGESNILLKEIFPYLLLKDKAIDKYAESWKPKVSYPKECIPDNSLAGCREMTKDFSTCDIILTGSLNMSSSEDFLDMVKYYGIACLIGTPSAGISGSVNYISLPSGAVVCFTGERAYSLSGMSEDFYFNGVMPHYFIQPTLEDISEKRDIQLERAIAIAEAGN